MANPKSRKKLGLLWGIIFFLFQISIHQVSGVVDGKLYKVLGIPSSANDAEIKKAHRNLAKKYHPDRNRQNQAAAAEKFKPVQEAYEILSDPQKRKTYDMYGDEGIKAAASQGQGQGHPGGFQSEMMNRYSDGDDAAEMLFELFGGRNGRRSRGFSSHSSGGGFGNIFSQMFGMDAGEFSDTSFGGGTSRSAQAQPVAETVEVTLEELFTGKAKPVTVLHRIRVPGSPVAYSLKHTYKLQLKPSWREGTTVRFPPMVVNIAQGGRAVTVPAVLVKILIARHKSYERVGDDLLITVQLQKTQAAKRLKLRIPLLDGTFFSFETKGRVSHGSIQEFPGRGLPTNQQGLLSYGKLIVKFLLIDENGSRQRTKA